MRECHGIVNDRTDLIDPAQRRQRARLIREGEDVVGVLLKSVARHVEFRAIIPEHVMSFG